MFGSFFRRRNRRHRFIGVVVICKSNWLIFLFCFLLVFFYFGVFNFILMNYLCVDHEHLYCIMHIIYGMASIIYLLDIANRERNQI